MARKPMRPGRTVGIFFLGLAIAFGLVALVGQWTPKLGLDLQGGTRITLVTKDSDVDTASLEEARSIIDQRVNGSGVSESEVTTQGNNLIVVEIPGDSRADLLETVRRQAQLRFRLVACSTVDNRCGAAATPQAPGQEPSAQPGSGVTLPAEPSAGSQPSGDASEGSSSKNRAPFFAGDKNGGKNAGNNTAASDQSSESPSPSESASPSDAGSPSQATQPPATGELVDQPLKWMDNPDPASVAAFNAYQCPPPGKTAVVEDDPDKPLVTCDEDGIKYLLSVAMIEGTDLKSADAQLPQDRVDWIVNLAFGGDAVDTFSEISAALFGTDKQFAIVLDGQVISAPTMEGRITDGVAQISGQFGEAEANSLATSLKFGALPISFDDDSTQVDVVGPSLAGNQLSAGLTAGAIGLLLVMLYCLIYYRGLGLVVIASLLVAGATTYALVLLLSESAGFTLSLPGVAGLIVGVGITADSFIVYFERIRDEMRDGKSMRVAVESGWARARNTCLAADAVSLLAAVVLYIFAAGVVKGFAFGLGLSTLIDLAVFFWFTHPMVSWLGRFTFFNQGHKLSGLDPEALGIDRAPVGGRA
jgi:preprotein translocase subunit SecD